MFKIYNVQFNIFFKWQIVTLYKTSTNGLSKIQDNIVLLEEQPKSGVWMVAKGPFTYTKLPRGTTVLEEQLLRQFVCGFWAKIIPLHL